MTGKTKDPLREVIAPIVEGQIRSFLHDHPEVLKGVTWYLGHKHDRAETMVNSLSKRIVNDLCGADVRCRIESAVVEFVPASVD